MTTVPIFLHLGKSSKSEEHGPRYMIGKITSSKVKERILQEARSKRPQGVTLLNDFSKKTLERGAEKIPDMLNARRESKIGYMIMDKLG